jgi:hypothetical protein
VAKGDWLSRARTWDGRWCGLNDRSRGRGRTDGQHTRHHHARRVRDARQAGRGGGSGGDGRVVLSSPHRELTKTTTPEIYASSSGSRAGARRGGLVRGRQGAVVCTCASVHVLRLRVCIRSTHTLRVCIRGARARGLRRAGPRAAARGSMRDGRGHWPPGLQQAAQGKGLSWL